MGRAKIKKKSTFIDMTVMAFRGSSLMDNGVQEHRYDGHE